jgi:hypothetical protein
MSNFLPEYFNDKYYYRGPFYLGTLIESDKQIELNFKNVESINVPLHLTMGKDDMVVSQERV